ADGLRRRCRPAAGRHADPVGRPPEHAHPARRAQLVPAELARVAPARRGRAPSGPGRPPRDDVSPALLADALDEEADAHLRAPLVEVVAAQPYRDDVDAADV